MTQKLQVKSKFIAQAGFTIVELLIYMALMSIFLVTLMDIFATTVRTKLASESTSALNMDSRYILTKLSYDINNADSITSPAVGATGSALQLVTGGVTAVYASISGNFTKSVGGTEMSMNGLDTMLDSLTFKNISNINGKPTIQVNYTLRSKIEVNGGTAIQNTSTTIGTR